MPTLDLSAAPSWFRAAVNAPCESHYAPIDGARVHYLTWNRADTDKPDLMLVHGFRAHARWWAFVAPYLAEHFRVMALEFSGMGDSEARPRYDTLTFVGDMLGAIEHAGWRKPTIVGHSFGGHRVIRACAEHPSAFARAVMLDSYVNFPGRGEVFTPRIKLGPRKTYPTYEAARARFRVVPEAGAQADYVLDYLAFHSIKQVEDGWTWKFDENQVGGLIEHDGAGFLPKIDIPFTIMHGEFSDVLTAARARDVVAQLKHGRGPIAIPEAHHHVMLDQPLALVAALRAALY
jgi:pimeloyl-ACP methyl ester carboxylesterase